MSFFILFNGMIIGLFFFSAVFSLFLATAKFDSKINFTFFVFATFIGLSVLFNVLYLKTNSVVEYVLHLKYSTSFIAFAGIAFIYLIAFITGYHSKFFKTSLTTLLGFVISLTIVNDYGLTWSKITEMKITLLPWGEEIFHPVGEVASILILPIIIIFLFILYSICSTRYLIKKGDKERGYFLIGTIVVGVLGLLSNQIILLVFDYHIIITDEIGYTGFVVLIAYLNFKSVVQSEQIKKELRKNEIKFRTLYENAGDGILVLEDGRIIDYNPKVLDLFKCREEYLLGKNIYDISPDYQLDDIESKQEAEQIINQALEGVDKEFEWIHKKENGVIFNAQINLNKFSLDGKDYLQARVRDITEHKSIMNQLRVSEYRFRTLVEGMNEAVIQVDNDDRIIFVNEKFTEIMGYTIKEIRGKIGYEIFLDPSDHNVIKDLNESRRYGRKNQYEISFYNKGGRKIDFLISGTPVYDFNGEVIGSFGVMTDITQRKKAEEAIKLSEEKFRSFIEQSTNGFVLIDRDGKIVEFNDAQEKLTGIKKEDAVGQFIWDVQLNLVDTDTIPIDEAKKYLSRIRRIVSTPNYNERFIEKIKPTELRIQSVDGRKLVILQTVFPIKTERKFYIGSMFVDITGRKASEEALKRERHNFMRVFENAPIAMQIVGKDYPFERVVVNDAYSELLGVAKNELINVPLTMEQERGIFSEDTMREIREIYNEKGILENYQTDITSYRNERKEVLITVKPIIFNDREYNLNVLQDVTEIEEAKQELQFALDYLQFIVDSIQSVIIAVDKDLKVTHYNNASIRYNGALSHENYIFDKFPKLKFIEDILLEAIQNKSDVDSISKTIVHKNGDTQHFQLSVSRLQNQQRPGFVILLEDITERRKMDDLMIQSEKMLSVAGLAAGMAHEINNPLGTIVQGCQNILRRTSDKLPKNNEAAEQLGLSLDIVETYLRNRQVYDIIESMRSAASKASEIIKNMLQFSRRSESKKVLYNIIKLVNDALELAYNDYDMKKKLDIRSIEVVKEFPESMPDIKLTVTEIEQVIFNILRNAAQALHDQKEKNKSPRIIFRIYRDNGWCVVEIEDNGPGMPDEVKNRVFEPFFTTKDIGEGTGLGLSVSYMIVKNNHNGILAVRSEKGVGSNFIIKLPI